MILESLLQSISTKLKIEENITVKSVFKICNSCPVALYNIICSHFWITGVCCNIFITHNELMKIKRFKNHVHTHTHLTVLFPGLPGSAGTRKVKLIWILLKQETVSCSMHLAPDKHASTPLLQKSVYDKCLFYHKMILESSDYSQFTVCDENIVTYPSNPEIRLQNV